MGKIVDENGFWLIKNNPVSKAGVFPYLGRSISPVLDPDKLYNVLRPEEELSSEKTISSFDTVPFMEGHEMIGEHYKHFDDRKTGGVMTNATYKDGILYGDLKIFSEDMKNKILNGKKELSLGYVCDYKLKKGVYNGQPYDAVQTNLRGNHIALVDRGRMGSDVRVYDQHQRQITFDSIDFNQENVMEQTNKGENNMAEENKSREAEDAKVDKRKLIDKIGGMAKSIGASEEQIRTFIKTAEEIAYNDSSRGTANDEEEKKKAEDAEKKSEKEELKKEEEPNGKKAEDAAPVSVALDEDALYRKFEQRYAKKNALVSKLKEHIGTFACDGMTPEEIAVFGCEKLGLDAANGHDAEVALNTYFKVAKKSPTYALDESQRKPFAQDQAPLDDCLKDYLAGK